MKDTHKKTKKFLLFSLMAMGWLALLLNGCDSNIHDGNLHVDADFFEYELEDGVLNVILDSNHIQESNIFETEEDFVSRTNALEQSGEITVNTVLWNELGHYFDPIEVSLLDMDRSVVVDGRRYIASSVAIHSQDLTSEGAELQLEAYYGEDGDIADKEIALIHANRLNLE